MFRYNVLRQYSAETFAYLRAHNEEERGIQCELILRRLVHGLGYLCISDRQQSPDFTINPVEYWSRHPAHIQGLSFFCPNRLRYRRKSKDSVIQRDWLVVEDDKGTLDQQVVLYRWLAGQVRHPLRMLVWSGNKSIHSFWEVDGKPCDHLLDLARRLGMPCTLNPDKFVRLPNGWNAVTRTKQEILWLDWQWFRKH